MPGLTMTQEVTKVVKNMMIHGGRFVQRLGKALACADEDNAMKIKEAWPEYWDKYLNWPEEE